MIDGLYPNTPFDDYAAWPLPSNTGLGKLARSPAHYREWVDSPEEPTPALVFGQLAHARILGNGADRFAVRPDGLDLRRKADRAVYDEWLAEHDGATVVTPDQARKADYMQDAVMGHPAARSLLERAKHIELSVAASLDGHQYKARPDALTEDNIIVDVKTTTDASPSGFSRAIHRFAYHRQAALYWNAMEKNGLDPKAFLLIAVEKDPPYAVAVYALGGMAIDEGRDQAKRLLRRYYECLKQGNWPAYGNEVMDIELPAWAYMED